MKGERVVALSFVKHCASIYSFPSIVAESVQRQEPYETEMRRTEMVVWTPQTCAAVATASAFSSSPEAHGKGDPIEEKMGNGNVRRKK